jgi:hypothetical protein
MSRALLTFLFLLPLAGCATAPERIPMKPLAEDGPPQPYADMVTRARLQASAANEAFYVNSWVDLEDAAAGLEQTSRFLGKASEVPPRHKATLPAEASELSKDAAQLRDAAKAKAVAKSNDILQRIHLKVRELRAED